MATVTAHDVAAEIREQQPGIGIKQLHKLLYFCQGVHLAQCGEPLFDDTIMAWDMGPVVAELWRTENYGHEPPSRAELDNAQLNTVGYVLSRYGNMSGYELEILTHNQSPWQLGEQARRRDDKREAPIRTEWIEEYFTTVMAAERDETLAGIDDAAIAAWLGTPQQIEQRRQQPAREDSYGSLAAWAHHRG